MQNEFPDKFTFHLSEFSKVENIINSHNGIDIVFADLGMSTMQLESDRGFSFLTDSELDMRMGNGTKLKNIINKMPRYKIANNQKTNNEDYLLNNIEKTAKRRGNDGDYIYHKGEHIFSQTYVVAGLQRHIWKVADVVAEVETSEEVKTEVNLG